MVEFWIELVAIVSQALYFGGWYFQLKESKKVGKSVNPKIYWVMTLIAQFLLGVYTLLVGSTVLPIIIFLGIMFQVYVSLENMKLSK